MIAFVADHGESFGEGGRWFVHGRATTPELARVPLVRVAPGLPAGRREAPPERVVFCDAGHDLSACPGDRYFRFWVPVEGGAARPPQGTFRWSPGAAPVPAAPDVPLARALSSYHEERRLARLRALGYAVPAQEED